MTTTRYEPLPRILIKKLPGAHHPGPVKIDTSNSEASVDENNIYVGTLSSSDYSVASISYDKQGLAIPFKLSLNKKISGQAGGSLGPYFSLGKKSPYFGDADLIIGAGIAVDKGSSSDASLGGSLYTGLMWTPNSQSFSAIVVVGYDFGVSGPLKNSPWIGFTIR